MQLIIDGDAHDSGPVMSLPHLLSRCGRFAFTVRERRSARDRRRAHVPMQARDLYRRASCAASGAERRRCSLAAQRLLIAASSDRRMQAARARARAGRSLAPTSALHEVTGVTRVHEQREAHQFQDPPRPEVLDLEAGAAHIARHFAYTWLHHDVRSIAYNGSWLSEHGRVGLDLQPAEMAAVAARLRRQNILDDNSVCPSLLEAALDAAPAVCSRCFDAAIADTAACSSVSIRALAFGKKSHVPEAQAVRLIVPMTSKWRVLDVDLSERLNEWPGSLEPLPDSCMECGAKGSGAQQAILGARLVIQKSLDDFSRGALLQTDIKQYYDHLSPVACARWMIARGCPSSLAAAAVRHQLCPAVHVKVGSFAAPAGQRARGSLTGSRTAGALGRVPVRDLHEQVASTCAARAYGPPGHEVILSTYVDNIMVVARDDTSAEAVLREMRGRLHEVWQLELPESSV